MNPENEQQILEMCPTLYGVGSKDFRGFSFECNDGWFDLILNLSIALTVEIAGTLDPVWEAHYTAIQVKEKYGTLRFYLSSGTERMYDLIEIAEQKSASICEVCGAPGSLRGTNWFTTLCEKDENKRLERVRKNA